MYIIYIYSDGLELRMPPLSVTKIWKMAKNLKKRARKDHFSAYIQGK